MPLCHRNNKHNTVHELRQCLCPGPKDQAIMAPFLSFTNSPNRFWIPPSLLANAQWGNSGRNVQVITRLYSVEVKKEWIYTFCTPIRGYAVAQLVEVLRYKPEDRGFVSRWCHWNISLSESFRPNYGPRADSASNRNEHQEYFLGGKDGRCVGLNLPADCLEIWESRPPGNFRACPGL